MATGAFAGLVEGFTRGYDTSRRWARENEEAEARKAEEAWRKEQQERQRRQYADDDAINAAIKGVKRNVPTYGSSIEDSEMYGPLAGDLQTTQRSTRDILAESARAVSGVGGLRGMQLGLQFQQGVDALDATQEQRRRQALADARQREQDTQAGIDRDARRAREAMADRQARVLEGMRNLRLMLASAGNDPSKLAEIAKGMKSVYEGVPDGRDVVLGNGTMAVATPNGRYVPGFEPVAITRENLESALDYAERYLDPNWATRAKVDTDGRRVDATIGLGVAQLGLSRDEHNARLAGRGGYGHAPPAPREPRPPRIIKGADGTQTALDANNKPLYNILDGGIEAPIGLTNSAWESIKRSATKAGVDVDIAPDRTGRLVVGYIGRDGNAYTTLQEAVAARPVRK